MSETGELVVHPETNVYLYCLYQRFSGNPQWTWTSERSVLHPMDISIASKSPSTKTIHRLIGNKFIILHDPVYKHNVPFQIFKSRDLQPFGAVPFPCRYHRGLCNLIIWRYRPRYQRQYLRRCCYRLLSLSTMTKCPVHREPSCVSFNLILVSCPSFEIV